ncbi:MAG: hypothetical protein KF778_11425 [Rhodocyclaceae bacterium]|nr:hypothetical protein [Rhodocyclaceae bacterium]MBX3669005.1 hypothetical protein [Rhodocyclaceae bacterium]
MHRGDAAHVSRQQYSRFDAELVLIPDTPSMHPKYAQLPEILRSVCRPGDFYHAGRREMFMPPVEIDGVGPLAFPVLPQQAKLP